jgi:hypothetical protein
MRGTYPWVDPVDYDGSLRPPVKVGLMERGDAGTPPGQLATDDRGYFVSHREGKIRLIHA